MKVKAKELGFYNHVRQRPGAVFEIKSEKEFSSRWMEKLTDGPPPTPAKAPEKSK